VSVGDPAASYVGVRFGRRQLPNWGVRRRDGSSGKSVEGLVGCWGVASLATLVALVLERDYYKVADLSAAAGLALMAGAGAAIAEATDVGVDDNLSLPLLSGLFMQAGVAVLAAV
jgi:dolichol kinase